MTKARDLADNAEGTKTKAVDAKGDLIVGTAADTAARLAVGTNGHLLTAASGEATGLKYALDPVIDLVTTKGDIVAATAADTLTRLAAGGNGETLVADTSATVGLRYTATPSASNPILNSSFDVWQRGTSFANPNSNAYVADRFQQSVPTNTTISRQATGDTTNLPSIQYNIRVQRNNAAATTGTFYLGQASEIENCVPFAGKTITFSFYARKGANYSSASDALTLRFFTGNTGTQQNGFTVTYTGSVSVMNEVFTLTTTWQRFTKTVTLNSDITQFSYWFQHATVGTAGAADYYDLTGVQIDVGSVALPFRRSSATLAGELAACQRYYLKFAGDATNGGALGVGLATSTTVGQVMTTFPVPLRIAPTALEQTGTAGDYSVRHGGGTTTCSAVPTIGNVSQYAATTGFTVASGLTAGSGAVLRQSGGTVAYLAWSAEL